MPTPINHIPVNHFGKLVGSSLGISGVTTATFTKINSTTMGMTLTMEFPVDPALINEGTTSIQLPSNQNLLALMQLQAPMIISVPSLANFSSDSKGIVLSLIVDTNFIAAKGNHGS